MTGSSVDLVRRMRAGDMQALGELLQRHLPGLRAFVRLHSGPFLRAREESTDLVQSICLRILRTADRFEHGDETAFRRWLFATALRTVQNKHRFHLAAKRDGGLQSPSAPGSRDGRDLLDLYASFCTPSQVLVAREEVRRIEAAFDELSPEQREVILLARVLGLSRASIGEQMGRSEGAVRMLLSRALARLTEILADR